MKFRDWDLSPPNRWNLGVEWSFGRRSWFWTLLAGDLHSLQQRLALKLYKQLALKMLVQSLAFCVLHWQPFHSYLGWDNPRPLQVQQRVVLWDLFGALPMLAPFCPILWALQEPRQPSSHHSKVWWWQRAPPWWPGACNVVSQMCSWHIVILGILYVYVISLVFGLCLCVCVCFFLEIVRWAYNSRIQIRNYKHIYCKSVWYVFMFAYTSHMMLIENWYSRFHVVSRLQPFAMKQKAPLSQRSWLFWELLSSNWTAHSAQALGMWFALLHRFA